jgi:hypothetical protein
MSDHDAAPDPIDQVYAQAEALLDDDAARAARRARVLAAVAQTAAEPQPAPAPSRTIWRRGGWLAAASVAGLSVFIAIQINRPPTFERPKVPPAPATPLAPSAAPPAPPAPDMAPAPPVAAAPPAIKPSVRAAEPMDPPRQAPSRDEAPAARVAIPPLPVPPVAAPQPPPPPAPAPSMERRLGAAPAQAPPRAEAPAASRSRVEEVVVTGSRIPGSTQDAPLAAFSRSAGEQAEKLRDAAAAGRTRELSVLLARDVPIDAADDDGETALMKSIQARQLDAAALLRRRGASLDLKNHEGRSARDMAADLADPKLNRALGLER